MSIDLFSIAWTDTNKQVAAALIGSAVGALIGALAAFLIGEHARKKQIEETERTKIRKEIKQHLRSLDGIHNNLHNLLIQSLKNRGHYEDLATGILDKKTNNTKFSMSLPQIYTVDVSYADNLLNAELVIQWTALETETNLHNVNTKEYTDYYAELRSSVHSAQLTNPESLKVSTIESDNETMIAGAKSNVKACDFYIDRCLDVLAKVETHLNNYKVTNYRDCSLKQLDEIKQNAIESKADKGALKKKKIELTKRYDYEAVFRVDEKS